MNQAVAFAALDYSSVSEGLRKRTGKREVNSIPQASLIRFPIREREG